jgi:hypothetical protein
MPPSDADRRPCGGFPGFTSRRGFLGQIGLAGVAAAAWPFAAQAQQSAMPVVGFLRSTPPDPFGKLIDKFRQGCPGLVLSKARMSSSSNGTRIIT